MNNSTYTNVCTSTKDAPTMHEILMSVEKYLAIVPPKPKPFIVHDSVLKAAMRATNDSPSSIQFRFLAGIRLARIGGWWVSEGHFFYESVCHSQPGDHVYDAILAMLNNPVKPKDLKP